ncbi:MAG: hypothetical protein Q4C49_11145 [Bacillota bacterium]|nr:hypothetical protein [Bacillota bacterium]
MTKSVNEYQFFNELRIEEKKKGLLNTMGFVYKNIVKKWRS